MEILEPTPDNIFVASEVVKNGGLVIYPTDTVYGLGCDPFNLKAVTKILNIKSRRNKPLPILALNFKFIKKIAYVSERNKKILSKLLPGPFTLVLLKKSVLSNIVTGNLDSVGVRVPQNDVATRLICLSGGLLIGTSANKKGIRIFGCSIITSQPVSHCGDVTLIGF